MRWHFFSFMVALFLAVVSCNNPHGEMGVADDETTTYGCRLKPLRSISATKRQQLCRRPSSCSMVSALRSIETIKKNIL